MNLIKLLVLVIGVTVTSGCEHFGKHHEGNEYECHEHEGHDHHDHDHEGHDHDHEGHAAHVMKLKLNNGKKWSTDKHLRVAMNNVHALIQQKMTKIQKDQLSADEYYKLGKALGVESDAIFKNCNLPAAADIQLHIIMLKLLEAKQDLLDKKSKNHKKSSMEALEAYKLYLKYFDHK